MASFSTASAPSAVVARATYPPLPPDSGWPTRIDHSASSPATTSGRAASQRRPSDPMANALRRPGPGPTTGAAMASAEVVVIDVGVGLALLHLHEPPGVRRGPGEVGEPISLGQPSGVDRRLVPAGAVRVCGPRGPRPADVAGRL